MQELIKEWSWARGLSISLLKSLSKESLLESPIKSAGAWWKQFRHLARVQENYTDALRTGKISFSSENSHYSGGPEQDKLIEYLEAVDKQFLECLSKLDTALKIDWIGKPTSLEVHIVRLIAHETLHHGQFILYSWGSGLSLPSGWEAWGEVKSS